MSKKNYEKELLQEMEKIIIKYYRMMLSEKVKEGLRKKKLLVKKSKVSYN